MREGGRGVVRFGVDGGWREGCGAETGDRDRGWFTTDMRREESVGGNALLRVLFLIPTHLRRTDTTHTGHQSPTHSTTPLKTT